MVKEWPIKGDSKLFKRNSRRQRTRKIDELEKEGEGGKKIQPSKSDKRTMKKV